MSGPWSKFFGESSPSRAWLMFGMILLGGIWGIYHVLMKPVNVKQAQLRNMQKQVRDAEFKVAHGDRAIRFLSDASTRCVASDPATVTLRYQEWLIKRTGMIPGIQVTAGTPIVEASLGARIPFIIEGEAEPSVVTDLLDEIQATPLLHRIDHLVVSQSNGRNQKSKSVQFSFELEAWALNGAENLNALPNPLPLSNRGELTQLIRDRRPFERGYFGQMAPKVVESDVKPKQTAASKPAVDKWKSFKLVGAVTFAGTPQAWFNDGHHQTEISLEVNALIDFDGFQGHIVHIDRDYIEVQGENGKRLRWPLGASLRDIQ